MKSPIIHFLSESFKRKYDKKTIPLLFILILGAILILLYPTGRTFINYLYIRSHWKFWGLENRKGNDISYRAWEEAKHLTQNPLPNSNNKQLLADHTIPSYQLILEEKVLLQLKRMAEHVWFIGYSLSTEFPEMQERFQVFRHWYPAQFSDGNRTYQVMVKLRGWTLNHYEHNHFSFRVKFQKSDLFQGKRVLELLVNYDKMGFLSHIIYEDLLEAGNLVPEINYAKLSVNDNLWGIYLVLGGWTLEEYIIKKRSEGVLIRGTGDIESRASPLDSLVKRKLREISPKPKMPGDFEYLQGSDFHFNYIKERLDIDKAARVLAWIWLLQDPHAMESTNVFFFFDPARGTLEPILFDPGIQKGGDYFDAGIPYFYHSLGVSLPVIPEIRHLRNLYLYDLVTTKFDRLIRKYNDFDKRFGHLFTLDKFYPPHLYGQMMEEQIKWLSHNAQMLRKHLSQSDIELKGDILINESASDLLISAIGYKDSGSGKSIVRTLKTPVRISGLTGVFRDQINWRKLLPETPDKTTPEEAMGTNLVTNKRFHIPLTKNIGPPPPPLPIARSAEPTISMPDFSGRVTRLKNKVIFGPGEVEIRSNGNFPEGFLVEFLPGSILKFLPRTQLVIRGNLLSRGTGDQPVRIHSKTKNTTWGIAVSGTPDRKSRVVLQHTVVEGGVGSTDRAIQFTSPLSIHDGTVTIISSRFIHSRAIDGINIKYSDIEITDSYFSSSDVSDSDGVDLDFCSGRFHHNTVERTTGDGLDISGSTITISDNVFRNIGDKAISIGEGSNATVLHNQVRTSKTGVAIKDGSEATIQNLIVQLAEIGIAGYVKKEYFPPPRVHVSNALFLQVETPLLFDGDTHLEIEKSAYLTTRQEGSVFPGLQPVATITEGKHFLRKASWK